MVRRVAAVAALLAAFSAAPAHGATWSDPEVVAAPADAQYAQYEAPRIAFGPGGTAAAAWTTDGLFTDPYVRFEPHRSGFAAMSADGAWSGTRAEEVDLSGELAVDSAGRVSWIAEEREAEDRDYTTVSIVMRSGHLSGGGPFFDRTQAIWPRHGRDLESDTSPSGASVAIWTGSFPRPRGAYRYAALRRPGKSFGRPVRLTGAGYADYAGDAAINDRGDAVVAWIDDGRVYARVARRGRKFGPRVLVARSGVTWRVFAGIDDSGRPLVAWNDGQDKDHVGLVAARQGSRGFRRPFALDTPGDYGHPRIERGAHDELLVAWRGSTRHLRVASITPARIAVQELDAADPTGVDVAARPDGTAALAWGVEGPPGEGSISVALRPPGGEFGPAETAVGPGKRHIYPTVTLDPATGQPVVGFAHDGNAAIARRR